MPCTLKSIKVDKRWTFIKKPKKNNNKNTGCFIINILPQIFYNILRVDICKLIDHMFYFQHANEDVEKMILGNKCDMDSKRQVSKERGDVVSIIV